MIKCNVHTHTNFCDGKDSPEEMVVAAIEKGFNSLGFSAHSKSNFDPNGIGGRKLIRYIRELARLKEKYKDKIEIFTGLEQDFCTPNPTEKLDYKIGSVHYLKALNGKTYPIDWDISLMKRAVNIGFKGDGVAFYKSYFRALDEMLSYQKPDICGHFDLLIKLNYGNLFFDEQSDEYKKTALDVLLKYVDKVIFEVNTGGMYRGFTKEPYPSRFLLEKLKENNAKIIITSDAHETDALDFYFKETTQMLKEIGFKKQCVLTKKGFIEQPL
ncbi:MAG: histidinol-phosphatase [Oscillospiraceae bacterium]